MSKSDRRVRSHLATREKSSWVRLRDFTLAVVPPERTKARSLIILPKEEPKSSVESARWFSPKANTAQTAQDLLPQSEASRSQSAEPVDKVKTGREVPQRLEPSFGKKGSEKGASRAILVERADPQATVHFEKTLNAPVAQVQAEKTVAPAHRSRPKKALTKEKIQFGLVLTLGMAAMAFWVGSQPQPLHFNDSQAIPGLSRALWSSSTSSSLAETPERERPEFRERVEYHRSELGSRLNRQRIDVEIDNERLAPRLPSELRQVPPPSIMSGLPLRGEEPHRASSRDRAVPANPNYPDSRVLTILQDEQEALAWEKRAREEYIREFIANAARQGLIVSVDKEGNVKIDGRKPSSFNLPSAQPDRFGPANFAAPRSGQ